jgi:hypothetical protein
MFIWVYLDGTLRSHLGIKAPTLNNDVCRWTLYIARENVHGGIFRVACHCQCSAYVQACHAFPGYPLYMNCFISAFYEFNREIYWRQGVT